MNANELADELERPNNYQQENNFTTQAATMLRQQQAELDEAGGMIGVLREQLQEEIQARADALDDLNNRMMKFMKSYNEMAYKLEEVGGAYTHPVKELSRMDIYELAIESGFMLSTQYGEAEHKLMPVSDGDTLVKLARAILRKAQEK